MELTQPTLQTDHALLAWITSPSQPAAVVSTDSQQEHPSLPLSKLETESDTPFNQPTTLSTELPKQVQPQHHLEAPRQAALLRPSSTSLGTQSQVDKEEALLSMEWTQTTESTGMLAQTRSHGQSFLHPLQEQPPSE